MEKQILALIEDEVTRRVQLRMQAALSLISRLYEIPEDRLIRDTVHMDLTVCQGILKSGKRCLKKPFENGFCKFHIKKVEKKEEAVGVAPWDS